MPLIGELVSLKLALQINLLPQKKERRPLKNPVATLHLLTHGLYLRTEWTLAIVPAPGQRLPLIVERIFRFQRLLV